jgi:hypothetical protein
MINTHDCFHKFNQKSTIVEELLNWCTSIGEWTQWQGRSLMLKFPPEHILLKDPLIKQLIQEGWREPFIMSNYPNSFYQFHVDRENRPCSFNLLLGHNDNCTTVFIENQTENRDRARAIEVPYEYGYPCLLNTHIRHGVFNFGKERYMLCISPPKKYLPEGMGETTQETGKNYKYNPNKIVTSRSKQVFYQIRDDFIERKL